MGEALNTSETLTGAYEALAGGVHTLTENMDGIVRTGQVVVTLVGTRMVAALAGATAAKVAATQQAVAYQLALARMAGASATATAAAGALRGALMLVGGPLGLLIGVGGLLYVFREELGLTGQRIGLTEGRKGSCGPCGSEHLAVYGLNRLVIQPAC